MAGCSYCERDAKCVAKKIVWERVMREANVDLLEADRNMEEGLEGMGKSKKPFAG